ncbi:hypothetical protein HU200_061886 [Digitaria exilis]|uniref:BTB domain-containing protein n=1 Tax=Digitaria exilis TaxID=1010633 RepID=A0A835A7Y7_9POAL|nr:hypothetical protein HU200_061886 [Digitaria exilis]
MSAASKFEFDSSSFTHQFTINLEQTKNDAIKHFVSSGDISAGGHLWKIECYPRGLKKEDKGEYLSLYLNHESKTKDAKAIFERSDLQSLLTNGSVIIMCGVKVVRDDPNPITVPPSDIKSHLGILLDSKDGSDVSFIIDGNEFPAHRAVLAARSPVFKEQLLSCCTVADAKMPSITLHDIAPATFMAMLRFIYTDDLLEDVKLSAETFQDLLAAADRYALHRLKLICVRKLWDDISITVSATLACAETHSCPELKKKCMDFFAVESNFKKAVLTDGYVQLVQKFPAIRAELRAKVGA